MLSSRPFDFAEIPESTPPLLVVVVDTEEDFDWSEPLSRASNHVASMGAQAAAHEIFAKFDIIPTYVVDYPVAVDPASATVLTEFLQAGVCEIGAHLHPWVNPPDDELVTPYNSYPGNLPAALEREKLTVLTTAIEQNLGVRPRAYRAGRYGIGANTSAILEGAGYDVDLSVVAHTSFTADGGPDFRTFGNSPYWFGEEKKLLEIPLTCGFAGFLSGSGSRLFPGLSGDFGMKLHVPGIAARSRLLERIRLTPEGIDHKAHRRLIDSLLAHGQKVFSLSYHSPSLQPGNTPYVRDKADLKVFLETLRGTLDYFVNEIGGQATTPAALFKMLSSPADTGNT